ncbi:MAG: hypothetical protein QM598_05910 [Protaetiibacter sp.]
MTDQPKIVQPKLASAFSGGAPDRAAGLSGLLPKRTGDAPGVSAESAATPAKAPAKTARPVDKPKAEPVDKPKAEPRAEEVKEVGTYLDPDVVAQLRTARRDGVKPGEPERTYDELLVDALAKVAIEKISAAFEIGSSSDNEGMPRRIRRAKGTGTNLIQHRLSTEQRDYLDRLAEKTGAPSRSALVNTVYRLAYELS